MDQGLRQLREQYAGIKKRRGEEFVSYNPARAANSFQYPVDVDEDVDQEGDGMAETQVIDVREHSLRLIHRLLDPEDELNDAILPVQLLQLFTREEITALEAEGLILSGVSQEQPEGGIFIKHLLSSSLGLEALDVRDRTIERIYATGVFKGVTEPISRAPRKDAPQDPKGLSRIPVDSMCGAVYLDGKWTKTYAIPDGKWSLEGFDTAALQYAQSCFEGMVASSDEEGNITLFRPVENARRFIKSAERAGMPPISVDQFMEAVKKAIQLNKRFVPNGGKLYIRPFMIGLQGGTGVKPATQYLFAVEVSPYGEYMTPGGGLDEDSPSGVEIKSVIHTRHSSGKDKVGGNYADVFTIKKAAKADGFKDILLIDDNGCIQECSSCNFFLVEQLADGDTLYFNLITPSLGANVLPGITRQTLIEILGDQRIKDRLGCRVNVTDSRLVAEGKIENVQGAFGTGTAAGITSFSRIKTTNGEVHFNHARTQQFITDLKKILNDLRRGKIPGYEKWAMQID
ncbi:MAG: aminotransferase class IV [bacterium]|nr:aminotransferase class IV [bacterium]